MIRQIGKIKINNNFLLFDFFILILGVFIFYFTPNILKYPYPENLNVPDFDLPTYLRIVIILLALIPVLIATCKEKTHKYHLLFRAIFYYSFIFVGLMKGSRGPEFSIISILLITETLVALQNRSWKLSIYIIIDLLLCFYVFFIWRYVRACAYEYGIYKSSEMFWEYFDLFGFDEGLSGKLPMLPQSLFHFLYVLDLVKEGISLNYSTFINLIPQQLPKFLDGILWKRPLNDNWTLAEYYRHGGGFLVYANAYWNYGLSSMIGFTVVLGAVVMWIDKLIKRLGIAYLGCYFVFISLLGVNLFYGIQPLVRGIEYGFVALLINWAVLKLFKKQLSPYNERGTHESSS
jgi:hypothetical protein